MRARFAVSLDSVVGHVSNFGFLKAEWPAPFTRRPARLRRRFFLDPRTAGFYARRALELAVPSVPASIIRTERCTISQLLLRVGSPATRTARPFAIGPVVGLPRRRERECVRMLPLTPAGRLNP